MGDGKDMGASLRVGIASARKRNWRGQFIKQMRVTPENDRVWLIWSKKWHRWHRRSDTGGACGYTDDLTQAGLFPYAKARGYNDGWDNTVFHVSEKQAAFEREIARMEAALAEFKAAAAQAIEAKREQSDVEGEG